MAMAAGGGHSAKGHERSRFAQSAPTRNSRWNLGPQCRSTFTNLLHWKVKGCARGVGHHRADFKLLIGKIGKAAPAPRDHIKRLSDCFTVQCNGRHQSTFCNPNLPTGQDARRYSRGAFGYFQPNLFGW